MKPFQELTRRGKLRRLHALATTALNDYTLKVTNIQFISAWTNTIYRIRTKDKSSYMLRICEPGWRTPEDLRSEVMWLQALHRDTNIGAPQPIVTKKGAPYTEVSISGVPQPRRCLITTWLPGKIMIDDRLNETNVYKMGTLFAQLHQHGTKFKPPKKFSTLKMTSMFVRKEDWPFFDGKARKALTPRAQGIVDETTAKVNAAYKKLYKSPKGLRVIHNDLHHENINVYGDKLYPYDFEDTVWGYPTQDIATAMFDLFLDAYKGYPPLRDAFRQGYESHSPWPETYPEEIDTLQIGFALWRTNFIARGDRNGDLKGWIRLLDQFLKTGVLKHL